MLRIHIKNYERGLLFKDDNYVKCLAPGKHWLNPFVKYEVVKADMNKPFDPMGQPLNLYLQDKTLQKELAVHDVADHQLALHFVDGKLFEVLRPGKYAFWQAWQQHELIYADLRQPEIDAQIDQSLYYHPALSRYVKKFEVKNYQQGILFYDHVMQKLLSPGTYTFWDGTVRTEVQTVDLRQQQIDLGGQEMLTEDKIALRLNFVCQYKVTDPLKVLEVNDLYQQLYVLLQLILREYVGTLKFDDLLRKKQAIADFVLEQLQAQQQDYGVVFLSAGVKDIILPGEIKEIINTVLIAEKRAQANVITRREETASTRSLLNTAKLMDENQTLYRLKELEFLEKICDKIGNISLGSGDSLLTELNALLKRY